MTILFHIALIWTAISIPFALFCGAWIARGEQLGRQDELDSLAIGGFDLGHAALAY